LIANGEIESATTTKTQRRKRTHLREPRAVGAVNIKYTVDREAASSQSADIEAFDADVGKDSAREIREYFSRL
jgi:hypothetical protein